VGRDIGLDDARAAGREVRRAPRTKKPPAPPPPGEWPGPYATPAPFPLDVFPPPLRSFVEAVSAATVAPPDVPALTLLTVAGAAIGTTRRFDFREDWCAYPLLFSAIVGESGTGKSPAMKHVLAPLLAAESLAAEDAEVYRDLYDVRLAQLNAEVARQNEPIVADNAKLPPAHQRPLVPAYRGVPNWPRPEGARRYLMLDTTMEALVQVHAANPRGLLVWRDEVVAWIHSMDAYRGGKGADRQNWLQIYDSAPFGVDRKGEKARAGKERGERLYLPCPFVAVLGSIQPEVLGDLRGNKGREDGFLPRLTFAYPPGLAVAADYVAQPLTRAAAWPWWDAYRKLIFLAHDAQTGRAQPVHPAGGVEDVFAAWYNAGSAEMRLPDFPRYLWPYWSKLRNLALRAALVIHHLRLVCGEEVEALTLDGESMRAGLRVADWSKSHTLAVVGEVTTSEDDRAADRLTAYIRNRGGQATLRQIRAAKQLGGAGTDRIRAVLHRMAKDGVGEWEDNQKGFRLADQNRP
jgi:hypothetical protein